MLSNYYKLYGHLIHISMFRYEKYFIIITCTLHLKPCVHSVTQYEASTAITLPLVAFVLGESDEMPCEVE